MLDYVCCKSGSSITLKCMRSSLSQQNRPCYTPHHCRTHSWFDFSSDFTGPWHEYSYTIRGNSKQLLKFSVRECECVFIEEEEFSVVHSTIITTIWDAAPFMLRNVIFELKSNTHYIQEYWMDLPSHASFCVFRTTIILQLFTFLSPCSVITYPKQI